MTRFFAFEGIDGAGKTTQANMLLSALSRTDRTVLLFRNPKESVLGKILSDAIQTVAVNKVTQALLYTANHLQLLEYYIAPALQSGGVVLVDRFWLSTLAHQNEAGVRKLSYLRSFLDDWPHPHTILIDIPGAVGAKRILDRDGAVIDRQESSQLAARYRDLAAANHDSVTSFDGLQTKEELHALILAKVLSMLR